MKENELNMIKLLGPAAVEDVKYPMLLAAFVEYFPCECMCLLFILLIWFLSDTYLSVRNTHLVFHVECSNLHSQGIGSLFLHILLGTC